MNKFSKSLLIATAIAAAAFAASAQGMMGGDHGSMGGTGRMDHTRMEKMMGRHLDGLKAKLKISPEQEAAWTTFAASMKPSMAGMAQHANKAEMDKLTTPERIDKMREMHKQRMTEMEANMSKRDDAVKAFYAVLNADQKKTFDAEHARMENGRHGKGDGPKHSMDGKGPQAKH